MHREPVFFATSIHLRRWFAQNAATATVLHVGFMRRETGHPSVTWPEAVDEALCVGWIDGIRHRIDGRRYCIRFTPRRKGSHWSLVNIRRMRELERAGRVRSAGRIAFGNRRPEKTGRGAHEQKGAIEIEARDVRAFRRQPAAWKYYSACPPGYRKMVSWWVISAKKPETRKKRLKCLIEACRKGKRLF